MDERRAVERHLIAVGRVAAFVAHALVLVEDRYALYTVAARFGHARVRAIGHVRSGQRSADHLQRFLVDDHLRKNEMFQPGANSRDFAANKVYLKKNK